MYAMTGLKHSAGNLRQLPIPTHRHRERRSRVAIQSRRRLIRRGISNARHALTTGAQSG